MKKLNRLIIVFCVLFIVGCGNLNTDVQQYDYQRFRMVEDYKDLKVYVDTDTGIAYGMLGDGSNSRVMFPLYDKDGNLYRPNGWRDWGGEE